MKTKFKPKKGQVDFTNIRWAPVMNCVVKHKDKFLIVQRNKNSDFYPKFWNGISGFLDDNKNLKEKVKAELKEELQIPATKIEAVKLGEIFDQEEPKYNKTWVVHPVLVEVSTDVIKLDHEAQDYKWITLKDVDKFKLLPGFNFVLEKLSKWL